MPDAVLRSTVGTLPPLLGGQAWGGPDGKGAETVAALLAGLRSHTAGGGAGLAANGAALMLGAAAHATGWPIPLGGSQAIPNALAMDLIDHGGRIETGRRVERIADLNEELVFCDTSPEDLARIGAAVLPEGYRKWLRATRRGPGSSAGAWNPCRTDRSRGGTRTSRSPGPCTWAAPPGTSGSGKLTENGPAGPRGWADFGARFGSGRRPTGDRPPDPT